MYEIRTTKPENAEENAVGLASIVVDNKISFNGIRIIKSDDVEKGLFISMPGFKNKSGEHTDFFYPATKEMYASVNEAVLLSYETGQSIRIGSKETKINTYVADAEDFGTVRANITLVCDKDFVCSTISLREDQRFGEEGNLYVAMPHYEKEGMYKPYVETISREFYKELESDIMKKYQTSIENTAERQKTGVMSEQNMTVTTGRDKASPTPASR